MDNQLSFCFVDDDTENLEQWKRWIEDKGHIFIGVDNALDANKVRADVFVFDISVVCPIHSTHGAYSAMSSIGCNHPGAIIAIVSAIPDSAVRSVIDDVKVHVDNIVINGGWGSFSNLENALKDVGVVL